MLRVKCSELVVRQAKQLVGIGRTDDAGIDLHACSAAHSLERAALHYAQNFLLHRHRDKADFVEKKSALVGRLEPAWAALAGPGEDSGTRK